MPTVAPSSNYTEASRRFQEALLNLEPGTRNGGLYADKPGYHNHRRNLPTTDYSVRAAADKLGPDNKSAAHDWTFPDAQSGRYATIIRYMDRVEAAFHARDPRLKGWREVLGQADYDLYAEGFDFDSWRTRTPDSSHLWHIHFSEHRAYVESWDNKRAMLSVLAGQSLADWMNTEGRITVAQLFRFQSQDWVGFGTLRELVDSDAVWHDYRRVYGDACVYPEMGADGKATQDLAHRTDGRANWTVDDVNNKWGWPGVRGPGSPGTVPPHSHPAEIGQPV